MRNLILTIFFILFYFSGNSTYRATTRIKEQNISVTPTTGLNRSAFYKAMEENDKTLVNAQLEDLKSAPDEIKPAFTGAMLMKRASFIGSAASKLHYFKDGRKMLETSIHQYPENAEFRFLRLMVQEHAPGALGYKTDIENDCGFIRKNYKSLPEDVQAIIKDYSKKSKFLKLDLP
jgi:hypothetical protein